MNGRTDNRHYKQEKTAQYTAVDAIELVNQNGSCPIPIPDLKQRIGPVAGFVDDHVIICGGFSMEEPLVKHFQLRHFTPIFALLTLTCLVTLFDRTLQVFNDTQNRRFGHF